MTDQINLRQRIEAAWSINSTFLPDRWTTENRAIGQCGVTSLYVQDKIGAILMEGWLDEDKTIRHFFNLRYGTMVDYTWSQFPSGTHLYHPKEITRSDILANDWFVERYQNFLNNVNGIKDGQA